MEVQRKFQKDEKYSDIFLPAVSALAAAHFVVCCKRPENSFEVIFASGYLPALASSFSIALLVFAAINLTSWKLDKYYPWERSKWKRFWLQLIVGTFGVTALAVVLAGLYFMLKGHHISQTGFFDLYFFMMLGYIVAINMYYNAAAIANWEVLGNPTEIPAHTNALPASIAGTGAVSTEAEPLKPGIKAALTKSLNTHDVVLFYTEKDLAWAREADGSTINWNFRLTATMKVLDPKQFFRVSRFHIVKRDAIASVNHEPLKEIITVKLKAPYNDEIRIAKTYMDEFNKWWYAEGE